MSREGLERFREYVRENAELERQLHSVTDQANLVRLSVQEGGERFDFNEDDVNEWLTEISQTMDLTYPITNMDQPRVAFIFY